jgi:diacylglycerol kinase family enzyme
MRGGCNDRSCKGNKKTTHEKAIQRLSRRGHTTTTRTQEEEGVKQISMRASREDCDFLGQCVFDLLHHFESLPMV